MRELAWDGYVNVRDLGGLPTRFSPRGTVRGRLARGPRRELLTDVGWNTAQAWGLRTVVDLRNPHEVGAQPGDPVSTPPRGVRVVQAPTEDPTNEEFRETCFPILDSPAYWAHNWRILPEVVLSALTAVADAEPGVLFHCSAGRDRTGMVTALLLANAGVPADAVVDDYAASVRAMAGFASHSPTVDRQASWSHDQVDAWLGRTTPVVAEVVSQVDVAFDVVGAPASLRARLRSLLVDA